MGMVNVLLICLFVLKSVLHPSHAKQSIFPKLSSQLAFGGVNQYEVVEGDCRSGGSAKPRTVPLVSPCFVGASPAMLVLLVSAPPGQPPCTDPLDSPIVSGPGSFRAIFPMVPLSLWLPRFSHCGSALSCWVMDVTVVPCSC